MNTDSAILIDKLDKLVQALSANKTPTVKDQAKIEAAKPREIVKEVPTTEVVALGPNVQKFFEKLFGRSAPTAKAAETQKKTGFWQVLLALFGAALVGLYEYWMKNIYPAIKALMLMFEEAWKMLKALFKEDGFFGKLMQELRAIFGKDGFIGRQLKKAGDLFSKEGRVGKFFKKVGQAFSKEGFVGGQLKKAGDLFSKENRVGRFFKGFGDMFSKEGSIGKLFSKEGSIGKFFGKEGSIAKFFSKEGGLAKFFSKEGALGRFFNMFKADGLIATKVAELMLLVKNIPGVQAVLKVLKVFAGIGKVFLKILGPIFAAIESYAAYKDEMTKSGDEFGAKIKGLMAFMINLLTFGLVNFDDMKETLDDILADMKVGEITIDYITKIILLVPEMMIKAIGGAIALIASFFDEQLEKDIKAWMAGFSLKKELAVYGDWWGDLISDYVIEPIMKLYYAIKDFFTITIPTFFKKIKDKIMSIFDSIANFDYMSVLENMPLFKAAKGVSNFFSSDKDKPKKVGQDFISRPNQDPVYFTSEDTVLGVKAGGPVEKLLENAVTTSTLFGEKTNAALIKQIELSTEANRLISELISAIARIQPNVMVNNNNNSKVNLNPGSMSSNFRNTVAA